MNNSNHILLIDPVFDPATSPTCNLLVKMGTDHLSYAIIHAETKQVYVIFDEQECEDGALQLKERLKTDSYLSLAYQAVKIASYTPDVVLIPNEIYNAGSPAAHAKFLTGANTAQLYTQNFAHFGLTTLFALPKSIDQLIGQWSNAKRYAHNAGLFALAENVTGTNLFFDFSVGSLHILFIKAEQVVFQQCYEIENIEELNYYLLLMISQLNIDPQNTSIHLSGIIHQDDEKYNCLSKYFNTIEWTGAHQASDLLEDMPAHYYSSLLALDLCVL